ncbi:hypothetical protein GGS20DRAFT_589387 [Poronia punctata]|nr:hypothetical protein GGS20DRAFT_589387 [Poronia punctata]
MSRVGFRVIIVGAGPVGLYMAHALEAAGIDYIVLEQQKKVVNYFGAMVFIWPLTVRLLDQIGLYEQAKQEVAKQEVAKQEATKIHAKTRVFGGDGSVFCLDELGVVYSHPPYEGATPVMSAKYDGLLGVFLP